MSEDNLTAVLYGINDIRLEQTDIEEPNENEVLLKMACVGICGSDVHYLVEGRIGDFIVKEPMIIGHEASGIVIKTGKNVKNLKIGDRVAIEPGVPCRICEFCKKGRYNLCKDIQFCATPPVHGNLRKFYKHAADFCFKLPDNVSLEEGALLEPLSIGVRVCKRAGVSLGSNVLILGAGPIGLVSLLVAKAIGARKVIIADINQNRLEFAQKQGADAVYLVNKSITENEQVQNICKLFDGEPDVTIDASGAESSVRLAILAAKPGGTALIVGMGTPEVKIPLCHALVREVDIKGLFRYVNDYPDALALVAAKKVNVNPMITHRYKLHETIKAFETSKSNPNAIKVMIYCD